MEGRKRWNIASPHTGAAELATRLRTSPLIAQILLNRSLASPEECQAFLRPSLNHLHSPDLLAGMGRAAQRVADAIRKRERIVIYGDYDVDGITAATILWHAIRTLGGIAKYYVPHRIDEGYGLNAGAIDTLCKEGAQLIISVDCGITAVEPAKVAAGHGVDMIITDHLEWHCDGGEGAPPQLPECYAIVHPRLPAGAATYPNPHLCGAGVAYKLAWGVGVAFCGARRVSDAFRKFLLDATALAALGTIADVVPLIGENRTLAHFGLGGLKQSKLTGIQALISSAGLDGKDLDSFDVGFRLGPRLNACGRLGHARLAVEMLTEATAEKAAEIASYLEKQNRERQNVEKGIVEQAIQQVEELKLDAPNVCGIVLGREEWHPGVIGIVASRIVERYHRPTIMIALKNGNGQGSGRSISGFHLAHALDACHDLLDTHGGHEMAAGLKLQTANFEAFRRRFCEHASAVLSPEQLIPELTLDAEAQLGEFSEELVNQLHRLGPFGQWNRRPILYCRDVEVTGPSRRVGRKNDHLQVNIRQGHVRMKCIGFGLGEFEGEMTTGARVDLAVEPTINEFNGRRNVELEIKDVRASGSARDSHEAVAGGAPVLR